MIGVVGGGERGKGKGGVFKIFVFNKFHDLEMGVKGHSRSLRVVSFDRLCMVSY